MRRRLTQMRYRTVAVHRRWCWSLWAPTTIAVESPKDLFVASHWLERSSCRFPASLLVESSRSQYFTSTNHVVFVSTFYWRLASKDFMLSHLLWLVPRPWRHTPRLLVMHVVFRSLLKIFKYAAKQTCKQLQCNKAKLLEPASINGLHIHRSCYASRTNDTHHQMKI